MMRKLFSTVAFGFGASLLVAGLAGCQPQEREPMAEVPPPAFDADEDFEPVAVEDYDDQPEPTEPAQPADDDDARDAGRGGDADDGTTYTVQRGDTLWSIANDHYGDGQRWRDIVEANPDLNGESLRVGDEIVLPD